MRASLVLPILAACSFHHGALGPVDGDTTADADLRDVPACATFDPPSHHVDTCTLPPGERWDITADTTYNTDTGAVSTGAAPTSTVVGNLRVVSVQSFSVAGSATLRAIGTKPLLVLSWSTITISGTLDVGSKRNGGSTDIGAGAGSTACQPGMNGKGQTQDCGGGGGAGYQSDGGNGGDGPNSSTAGPAGGGTTTPTTIIAGGCAGGDGGTGAARGHGGPGGGAIQLTSKDSITVTSTGRINAGGAGGQGANNGDTGGGGGGSGGYIGLDAPSLLLDPAAIIAANGGGGGEGCDNTGNGKQGTNAALGTQRALGAPANNASSCNAPNAGGDGGALAGLAGLTGGTNGTGSGGGGGGGVGFVLVWGVATPPIASPAIMQMP